MHGTNCPSLTNGSSSGAPVAVRNVGHAAKALRALLVPPPHRHCGGCCKTRSPMRHPPALQPTDLQVTPTLAEQRLPCRGLGERCWLRRDMLCCGGRAAPCQGTSVATGERHEWEQGEPAALVRSHCLGRCVLNTPGTQAVCRTITALCVRCVVARRNV